VERKNLCTAGHGNPCSAKEVLLPVCSSCNHIRRYSCLFGLQNSRKPHLAMSIRPQMYLYFHYFVSPMNEAKRTFGIWSLGGSVGLTTIDLHGYEAATGHVNMDNQTHG